MGLVQGEAMLPQVFQDEAVFRPGFPWVVIIGIDSEPGPVIVLLYAILVG